MADVVWSTQVRCRYAEALRHFLAGRLTTDEYEDVYFDLESRYQRDEGVWAVFACVWHLYDDLIPHRMTGRHRLGREARCHLARWVVFLRSGAELADVSGTPLVDPRRRLPKLMKVIGIAISVAIATCFVGLMMIGAIGVVHAVGATLLLSMLWVGITGSGVSLESRHASRAFSDDPHDPWPFRSREELRAAVARPTYLHG